MKIISLLLALSLFCVELSASPKAEAKPASVDLAGTIRIRTSPMFMPVLMDRCQQIAKENGKIRIKISKLKQDKLEDNVFNQLQQETNSVLICDHKPNITPKGYEVSRIANKEICLVVNKANSLKIINKRSIAAIYAGTMTNWEALAQKKGNIYLACPPASSDEWEIFRRLVLAESSANSPEKTYQIIKRPSEMVNFVAETPNAIGIANILSHNDKVRALKYDGNDHPSDKNGISSQLPLRVEFYLCHPKEPTELTRFFLDKLLAPANATLFHQHGFSLSGQEEGVGDE